MDESTCRDTDSDFFRLMFALRRSARYHDHRRHFYRSIQNSAIFVAFIFGTSTLSLLYAEFASGYPLWVKSLPSVVLSL